MSTATNTATVEIDPNVIARLAAQCGLGESYYDHRGEYRVFSLDARRAILERMGCDVVRGIVPDAVDSALTTVVCDCADVHVDVALPAQLTQVHCALQLEENGEQQHTWQVDALPLIDGQRRLSLGSLPPGYHQLTVQAEAFTRHILLIVTPTQCFEPEAIVAGARLWGLSIQLYTLRSARNWGMGDFADLRQLVSTAATHGCALIGLNPLHALRPAAPAHISPYSPSSRRFLNVLYIAVDAVPGFMHSVEAQRWFKKHAMQLQALRDSEIVDYAAVAAAKLTVLRMLHAEFSATSSEQHVQFTTFVTEGGTALRRHALYDALDAHFSQQPAHTWGWRSWPAEFHVPDSDAVRAFAAAHAADIDFYLYLQWLASTQWREVQAEAVRHGMTLGLYGDVAVGVDPNGSEIWSERALYVDGVSVGAPPDPLALKGQDWGIPPQHPLRLKQQGYAPFIGMLRANMQACGALRIDHVMALCRLWWVPQGFEATDGVYVQYPLDDLVRIAVLESHRQRCVIIGEDLGTVPDAMREAMARHALYHYKVLFFEKAHDGEFIAPEHYPRRALAVVTTHDLPPFRAWWESEDITLRQRLHQYPDDAVREQVQRERHNDRRALMRALSRSGLWSWQGHEELPPYSFELMRAAYLYAGLSQAALLVVQPEDLLGMSDPVNVPGTSVEHPNWQRKLSADLDSMFALPKVIEFSQALLRARRGHSPNS